MSVACDCFELISVHQEILLVNACLYLFFHYIKRTVIKNMLVLILIKIYLKCNPILNL